MDKDAQIDLIEKYLNKELSAEEQQAFDYWSENPDFEAKLQRRRLAHQLLDYSITKDLREELRELEAADKVIDIRVRRKKQWLTWSAAAAGILLLLGLLFFMDTPAQPTELALEYYHLPDNNIRGSSLENVSPDRLQRGMVALESGSYRLAAATFDSIGSTDENYLPAQYFQAHAYFQLKQYDQAEAGFANVLSANDMRYSEEAAWYALLSCLAQDSTCSQRLDLLLTVPDQAFYQEALEINKRLK